MPTKNNYLSKEKLNELYQLVQIIEKQVSQDFHFDDNFPPCAPKNMILYRAEYMGTDRKTTSRQLDALVRRGLLTKRACKPTDDTDNSRTIYFVKAWA